MLVWKFTGYGVHARNIFRWNISLWNKVLFKKTSYKNLQKSNSWFRLLQPLKNNVLTCWKLNVIVFSISWHVCYFMVFTQNINHYLQLSCVIPVGDCPAPSLQGFKKKHALPTVSKTNFTSHNQLFESIISISWSTEQCCLNILQQSNSNLLVIALNLKYNIHTILTTTRISSNISPNTLFNILVQ